MNRYGEHIYDSSDDVLINERGELCRMREEIIRCRDCRYHVSVTDGDVCRKPCGDEAAGRAWVEPTGFCAWASRKRYI